MRTVRAAVWIAAGALAVGCGPGAPVADDPTGSGSATPSTSESGAASPTPTGTSPVGCPPGSTPYLPGAADQARPGASAWFQLAAMAPAEPAIVVGESGLVPVGAGMWSLQSMWAFDVCTNSWQERGASSLPAPNERPALGQFVSHEGAGLVLGLPVGLAPVWSYESLDDQWTQLSSTGGGGEAWPFAVYDPDGDRLLAFEAHNSTVKSYDLAADAWSVVDSAEPSDSPDTRPNARMDQVDLAYDSAEHLLILVITPSGAMAETAETWAFDPDSRRWSRRADVPNTLELGYPSGWAAAFDPWGGRTWLFAETAMLAYDARADEWTVAERGPGWPVSTKVGGVEVDPVARLVDTMVVDPINERLVVIGGLVRRVGDPVGGFEFENSTLPTDDVWAYDPATNTWTLLLPASDHPASLGPG
jgi:Kelch motif